MSAVFSPDGRYRYQLGRVLRAVPPADSRRVLFVGLNPSKAGRVLDGKEVTDPSATRMTGFATTWGFDCLTICNMFGLIATDPRDLRDRAIADAIGPSNDGHLRVAAASAALIVACWGGSYPRAFAGRARYVRLLLEQYRPVHHLGLTQAGDPRHPLYLRADTVPSCWEAA